MGLLVFQQSSGGTINVQGTNTASAFTWTIPASTDTFVGLAASQTLTSKTLTSPVISGGTIDNATIGATTQSSGKFTTLTSSSDATLHGLTVGLGGGSVSTNTVVGVSALQGNSSGAQNTALGYQALYNTTAGNNTGIGYQAGNLITSGGSNTSIGQGAHNLLTTGNNNIAIGQGSGQNIVSGYQTIYIGSQAYASSGSVNNEICIATYLAAGKGSQTAYLDSNGSTGAGGSYYNGANSSSWNTTSDQRLKKNIVDNTVGLTAINGIKVRNFEYRLPDEITDLDKSNAVNIVGTQLGVIAQELKQVLPDCVKTESTGVMSVDSSDVLWHLVTAVQQLSAQVTALQAKVGA